MSHRESLPAAEATVTRSTFARERPRLTLTFSSDFRAVVLAPSQPTRSDAGRYSMIATGVTS